MKRPVRKKYQIDSPLTVKQWKKSWDHYVVEDNRDNRKLYREKECYYGNFKKNDDFVLYFHRELDGNSLSTFFFGKIEKNGRGSRITGYFSKKKSANIFLIMGILFTSFAAAMFATIESYSSMVGPVGLCLVLLFLFFMPSRATEEDLLLLLQEISFPTKNGHTKNKRHPNVAAPPQHKATIEEAAAVNAENVDQNQAQEAFASSEAAEIAQTGIPDKQSAAEADNPSSEDDAGKKTEEQDG